MKDRIDAMDFDAGFPVKLFDMQQPNTFGHGRDRLDTGLLIQQSDKVFVVAESN